MPDWGFVISAVKSIGHRIILLFDIML